ncbi:MAG: hypothetical protein ABIH41_02830, partial [Nanoarchaeota archaeon]
QSSQGRSPRRALRRMFVALIVLLVILLILLFSSCESSRIAYRTQQVPVQVQEPYVVYIDDVQEECQDEEYLYAYEWTGWVSASGSVVTPILTLQNQGERQGTFEVQFAFFDLAVYPFDTFKDILSYEDAQYFSPWVSLDLESFQIEEISIPTDVPAGTYWAIADIVPPTVRSCVLVPVQRQETHYTTRIQIQDRRVEYVERVRTSWLAILGTWLGLG